MKNIFTKILAFISGTINGLFAVGGGVLGVPMLYRELGDGKKAHQNVVAFILPLSILSAAIYQQELIDPFAQQICIGAFFGGVLGSLISKKISLKYIKIIFGIIVCFTGVKTII